MPSENSALFFDPALAALAPALKSALPASATVESHPAPRGPELVRWVRAEAKAAGGSIDDAAITALLERLAPGRWRAPNRNPAFDVPPELEQIAAEVAKLVTYAEDGAVTAAHVAELTPAGEEDALFPLVDAITTGDRAAALRRLHALGGSDVDELSRILNQLFTTVELAPLAAQLRDDTSREAVAKQIGLSNGRRLAAVARAANSGGTRAVSTGLATSADRGMKLGRLRTPAEALLLLVLGHEKGAGH